MCVRTIYAARCVVAYEFAVGIAARCRQITTGLAEFVVVLGLMCPAAMAAGKASDPTNHGDVSPPPAT